MNIQKNNPGTHINDSDKYPQVTSFSKQTYLHSLFIRLDVKSLMRLSEMKWFMIPATGFFWKSIFWRQTTSYSHLPLCQITQCDPCVCLHCGDSWTRSVHSSRLYLQRTSWYSSPHSRSPLQLTKFLISIQICQTSFWHSVSPTYSQEKVDKDCQDGD